MYKALGLALSISLAACAAVSGPNSGRARSGELAARWRYEIRIDRALSQIDATVCFEGAVPVELRPGKDEAAVQLKYARWLSPGAVHRLPVENGRIQLDASARDACVAYGIGLAEGGSMGTAVRRVGRDVIASPNVWLWRPERRSANATARLRLVLPEGMSASLPWAAVKDSDGVAREHVLDADAFRFDSHAAFGRFSPITLTHRGVQVEAALLDGPLALDRASAARWLARAVDIASLSDGRFPSTRLQVIAVPSGASLEPVPFGMVARGGAGSVMLFVGADASEAALAEDWVLPHELSHLFLPFVKREHAWLPEGLATYYQEVLRARASVLTETEALEHLTTALRSASREGTGRTLEDESLAMYQTYAFRAVYWGGAAYFLIADVELRRRSHGHKSLDTVLSALRDEGAHDKMWEARALLRHMDELAGESVFTPLADTALARPFPDFEPTLDALGVRSENGTLSLDDGALLADVRRSLFGPRPPMSATSATLTQPLR